MIYSFDFADPQNSSQEGAKHNPSQMYIAKLQKKHLLKRVYLVSTFRPKLTISLSPADM